ncbi:MAG TPA: phosphoglycerate mutase family protein [Actinoplanes sp.]
MHPEAPLRLILIRPGTWAPPAPGEPLGGLTAAGRAQARACGRWLRSVAVPLFTAGGFSLVSSPARQARQTAELLGLGPWTLSADLSRLPARGPSFAAGAYPSSGAAADLPRMTPADLRERVTAWLAGPEVAGASAAAVVAVCPLDVLLAVRTVLESDSPWLPGPCDVLAYSRLAPGGEVADRYRWRAWVPQPWSAPPGWNENLWRPIN